MIFPRIIKSEVAKYLQRPEILIIYGPRRTGKTTLLNDLKDDLAVKNKCVSYTLDDPASSKIFQGPSVKKLERIFKEIEFSKKDKNYLFLDEVQALNEADILMKLVYDHFPHVKIIATSSSSLLLLDSLSESLAGRKYFFELLPLTLGEIFSVKVKNYFGFKKFITKEEDLRNGILQMAIFGSYPEVQNAASVEEKTKKLKEMLESYLYRDILVYERIKSPRVLMKLVELLAFQIGSLVNPNELSQQLGISRNTVGEYIGILEKFFIIFRLGPLSGNLRNEMGKRFKVYFWDLGIRNAVTGRFYPFETREDKGALFENLVVASVLKRNHYHGKNFNGYFWRNYQGSEVDLVLQNTLMPECRAFQITVSGKARFPEPFEKAYLPTEKHKVRMENGYVFCL